MRYEILHQPAHTLDPVRAATLRAQILALNLQLNDAPAFQANWRARIGAFFEGLEWLDLAWKGDRLVGHYGMRRFVMGRAEAFYVDNFTVDPTLQGSGVGRALTGRSNGRLVLRSLGRPVYLLARTQNPVVGAETAAAIGTAAHYYPNFAGPSDPGLTEIAAHVAGELRPDKRFDPATGVLEAAYGGRFLDVAPTRRPDAAAYFERHIDLDRGDALVLVMRLCFASWGNVLRYFAGHALRRLRRRRRSRPAVA